MMNRGKKILGLVAALVMLTSVFSSVVLATDIELYHSVTFILNDGTENFLQQYVQDGEYIAAPEPTKDNHTFAGWFTEDGILFDFEETPITEAIIFHAQWTLNEESHTVTFNLHGGAGDFPVQNVLDGAYAIEPETSPTKEGYTFAGWFTAEEGGTLFDFESPITANTEIHAQWNLYGYEISHTVTFNLHGGTGNFPAQNVLDGEYATEPETNPTKANHTFDGWFTAEEGGTQFDFESAITADTEIHARWTLNEGETTHTVTFNLHGGTGNFPVQNVQDGEFATEPATNPTRANHTFDGWFTAETGGTLFDFDTPITAATILHARWTLNEGVTTHTVTFNLHGGTGNFPAQNVLDGEYATRPVINPTRANHLFVGWYTAATGGILFDFDSPITAATEIHARWALHMPGGGNQGGGHHGGAATGESSPPIAPGAASTSTRQTTAAGTPSATYELEQDDTAPSYVQQVPVAAGVGTTLPQHTTAAQGNVYRPSVEAVDGAQPATATAARRVNPPTSDNSSTPIGAILPVTGVIVSLGALLMKSKKEQATH